MLCVVRINKDVMKDHSRPLTIFQQRTKPQKALFTKWQMSRKMAPLFANPSINRSSGNCLSRAFYSILLDGQTLSPDFKSIAFYV